MTSTAPTIVHPLIRRAVHELQLTERQTQIVELLACGQLPKLISAELGLSHHTLRTHLLHIYSRVQVSGRVELLALLLARVAEMAARTATPGN